MKEDFGETKIIDNIEDIEAKASDIAEDVSEKAADIAEDVSEKAADIAENVSEKAADIESAAADAAQSAADAGSEVMETAESAAEKAEAALVCAKCGKRLSPGALYCTGCGTAVAAASIVKSISGIKDEADPANRAKDYFGRDTDEDEDEESSAAAAAGIGLAAAGAAGAAAKAVSGAGAKVTGAASAGKKAAEAGANNASDILSGRKTGTNAPRSGGRGKSKKGIVIPIVIAAAAAAVGISAYAVTKGMGAATVDMNLAGYVSVEAEGYDGYGKAELQVDTQAFEAQYGEAIAYKGQKPAAEALAEFEKDAFDVSLSKSSGIRNDETVSLVWNVESAELAEKYNVNAELTEQKYLITGLEELTKIDPFSFVTLSYSGYNGSAKPVAVVESKADYASKLTFKYTPDGNLKNGDIVTVSLADNFDEDAFAEKYGVLISLKKKEFRVEGLEEAPAAEVLPAPASNAAAASDNAAAQNDASGSTSGGSSASATAVSDSGTASGTSSGSGSSGSSSGGSASGGTSGGRSNGGSGSGSWAEGAVFSDSSSRTLSEGDLSGLSSWELRVARNEIYARHGRLFNDSDLQNYFNSLSWYNGYISPSDFSDSMLSDVERQNVNTIYNYENSGSGATVTGYMLPSSSSSPLRRSDLSGFSAWECKIARNEIYARHGRLFNDPDLQNYFNSCTWYNGTTAPSDFNDTAILSQLEKDNIKVIEAYERSHGYNGY